MNLAAAFGGPACAGVPCANRAVVIARTTMRGLIVASRLEERFREHEPLSREPLPAVSPLHGPTSLYALTKGANYGPKGESLSIGQSGDTVQAVPARGVAEL